MEEKDLKFTNVDPSRLDPLLQKVYTEMQAGLTKKFQELAEAKKSIEAERGQFGQRIAALEDALNKGQTYVQQLEASHKALQSANQQWESYVKQTLKPVGSAQPTGQFAQRNGGSPDGEEDGQPGARRDPNLVVGPDGQVYKMADPVEQLKQKISELETKLSVGEAKTGSQLNIVTQIGELQRKYGTKAYFDPRAVLKTALDKRIDDLDEAFERTYSKEIQREIIDEEVKRGVEEALKAQDKDPLASRQAGMGIGNVPYMPDDEFATYDDANKAFLAELAQGKGV